MTMQFESLPIERVVFGPGTLGRLGEALAQDGCRRVMVVTSPSVARSGVFGRVIEQAKEAVVAVFDKVRPHVPDDTAFEAANILANSEADTVLTVGGGSSTDTGKAIRLIHATRVSNSVELSRYRSRRLSLDDGDIPPLRRLSGSASLRVPRQIAVPTTLSGGEFSDSCAITDTSTRTKHLHIYRELVPNTVLLDPKVAFETPMSLWLSTGVKAIDHCVEQVYSAVHQPVTDALGTAALPRLLGGLTGTLDAPDEVEHRSECQVGAWMAIYGLMNIPTGLSHAIGHQLGARFGVPHGITSCLSLPAVLAYIEERAPASLEPLKHGLVESRTVSEHECADLAGAVSGLIAKGGLPSRLRELGVSREQVMSIADEVLKDPLLGPGPIDVHDPASLATILDNMW